MDPDEQAHDTEVRDMTAIKPNENNTLVYCIPHCPADIDGAFIKNTVMNILAGLLAEECDGVLMRGERVTLLLLSPYAPKGDYRRFEDEVVRYVDLFGATNNVECDMQIAKFRDRIKELGGDIMGTDILDRYIDRIGVARYGTEKFETRIDRSE